MLALGLLAIATYPSTLLAALAAATAVILAIAAYDTVSAGSETDPQRSEH